MKKINFKKLFVIVFIPIFTLPIFSACWDMSEIDTIAIVTGLGLDAAEDDQIKILIQVAQLSNEGSSDKSKPSGGGTAHVISEITAKSIVEGLAMMKYRMSRLPFLHHNQIIIIGRELAERGFNMYLDTFLREHEMRSETLIVVAENTAKEILEAKVEIEKIPATALAKNVKSADRISSKAVVDILSYTSTLLNHASTPYMPLVKVHKSVEHDELLYNGMALFKDGKMFSQMDFERIKGFVWLTGTPFKRSILLESEQGNANVKFMNYKINQTPSIVDEKLFLKYELKSNVILTEINGFKNKEIFEIKSTIEKMCAEKIKEEMTSTLSFTQEIKADIFQTNGIFHRKFPKEWNSFLKDNWDEAFADLEMDINIKITLIDTGGTYEGITMKGGAEQ